MRSIDHTGDKTEDSSGLSGSSETTYFRMGDAGAVFFLESSITVSFHA